jgi:hypothetical protein
VVLKRDYRIINDGSNHRPWVVQHRWFWPFWWEEVYKIADSATPEEAKQRLEEYLRTKDVIYIGRL